MIQMVIIIDYCVEGGFGGFDFGGHDHFGGGGGGNMNVDPSEIFKIFFNQSGGGQQHQQRSSQSRGGGGGNPFNVFFQR